MPLVLKTAPTAEPVTLAELRDQCRVSSHDEDALLAFFGKTARIKVEDDTRRSLMPQTWYLYLDQFPEDGVIELRRPPAQSITGITYTDSNGTAGTFTTYELDAVSEPARLQPAYGYTWPSTYDKLNCIRVEWVAGYSSSAVETTARAAVNEKAKLAVRLLAGHWYEQRVDTAEKALLLIPNGYQALIRSLKWGYP